jgi:hypothetical protein
MVYGSTDELAAELRTNDGTGRLKTSDGNLLPFTSYRGYRTEVNPGIANIFSTAAYRFGHSMLSTELKRLGSDGRAIEAGHLSLADAFFKPQETIDQGIEPILRGLAAQVAQEIDNEVIDDIRNFLFGPPGAGGFDLAALNIQRGRDHGLGDYNSVRQAFGLQTVQRFSDISRDPAVQANLADAYTSVNDIDAWGGGLAESRLGGALVGETWRAIIADQFIRLRDGDRFFYREILPTEMVAMVEAQSLATIILRNTTISRGEIPGDVFRADMAGRILAISGVEMDAVNHAIKLTWESVPSATYRIEASLNGMRRWNTVAQDVQSQGIRTSATIQLGRSEVSRMFRIRQE